MASPLLRHLCRVADRQGKSLAAAAGMGPAELAVWAAWYGSKHDPAAQKERRLMRQLGMLGYYITAAAGAKVTVDMFIDADEDRPAVNAGGPGAERAFERMLRAKGHQVN